MKHRIVGDHHQVIAFELGAGDELLIFSGKLVFSKESVALQQKSMDIPNAWLQDAATLRSPGGKGLAGIVPTHGGHIKRYDIGPPSGLVVIPSSIFILSRGVLASPYKPSPEITGILDILNVYILSGAGAAFLRTDENFLEFTLGSDEELCANIEHILGFSGAIKMNPAPAVMGKGMVLFSGPGNVILAGR